MHEKNQACQTNFDEISDHQINDLAKSIQLRKQILELASCLDAIIDKDRQKKTQSPVRQLFGQDLVIKEQMSEIEKLKHLLRQNQRKLQIHCDDKKHINLEEQVQLLLNEEKQLRLELAALKKISTKQQQALGYFTSDDAKASRNKEQKADELKSEKRRTKQLQEQIRVLEVQLKEKHEAHYKQNEKLKMFDQKSKQKHLKSYNQEDISILQNQLQELQYEIEQKQFHYAQAIRHIDRERRVLNGELLQKEKILREREREHKHLVIKTHETQRFSRNPNTKRFQLPSFMLDDISVIQNQVPETPKQ